MVVFGLYFGYIRVMYGCYRGYFGIMIKFNGNYYSGFRVQGFIRGFSIEMRLPLNGRTRQIT